MFDFAKIAAEAVDFVARHRAALAAAEDEIARLTGFIADHKSFLDGLEQHLAEHAPAEPAA